MANDIKMNIKILRVDREIARHPDRCIENPNVLSLSVSYSKGGINYFTYKDEPRGYYLHITPQKLESREFGAVWQTVMGSGCKLFLHSVQRQSEKQQKIAVEKAKLAAQSLIDWCRDEYGIIAEPVENFFA